MYNLFPETGLGRVNGRRGEGAGEQEEEDEIADRPFFLRALRFELFTLHASTKRHQLYVYASLEGPFPFCETYNLLISYLMYTDYFGLQGSLAGVFMRETLD